MVYKILTLCRWLKCLRLCQSQCQFYWSPLPMKVTGTNRYLWFKKDSEDSEASKLQTPSSYEQDASQINTRTKTSCFFQIILAQNIYRINNDAQLSVVVSRSQLE